MDVNTIIPLVITCFVSLVIVIFFAKSNLHLYMKIVAIIFVIALACSFLAFFIGVHDGRSSSDIFGLIINVMVAAGTCGATIFAAISSLPPKEVGRGAIFFFQNGIRVDIENRGKVGFSYDYESGILLLLKHNNNYTSIDSLIFKRLFNNNKRNLFIQPGEKCSFFYSYKNHHIMDDSAYISCMIDVLTQNNININDMFDNNVRYMLENNEEINKYTLKDIFSKVNGTFFVSTDNGTIISLKVEKRLDESYPTSLDPK